VQVGDRHLQGTRNYFLLWPILHFSPFFSPFWYKQSSS